MTSTHYHRMAKYVQILIQGIPDIIHTLNQLSMQPYFYNVVRAT